MAAVALAANRIALPGWGFPSTLAEKIWVRKPLPHSGRSHKRGASFQRKNSSTVRAEKRPNNTPQHQEHRQQLCDPSTLRFFASSILKKNHFSASPATPAACSIELAAPGDSRPLAASCGRASVRPQPTSRTSCDLNALGPRGSQRRGSVTLTVAAVLVTGSLRLRPVTAVEVVSVGRTNGRSDAT